MPLLSGVDFYINFTHLIVRMLIRLVITLLILSSGKLFGQCLTTYNKLIPDAALSYTKSFGQVQSIYDNTMVISAPGKDTLGFASAGVVYLYTKVGTQWIKNGALLPSVSVANMGFGFRLYLSADYIMIGGSSSVPGLYIYRKPASGWTSSTETVILKPAGSTSFGSSIALSPDQQTLVVSGLSDDSGKGAFYVFHKSPSEEWNNSIAYQKVINPDPTFGYFGVGGIQIRGNVIACGKIPLSGGPGVIYMFEDLSGNFTNFQLTGRLNEPAAFSGGYGPYFQFTDDGVFKYLPGKILYYQSPLSGSWLTANPTCEFPIGLIDGLSINNGYVNYVASSGKLYLSSRMQDGSGRITVLRKVGSDWCNGITKEVIYSEPAPLPGGESLFVRSLSIYNDSEIVASWMSLPESLTAVGVSTFSFDAGNNKWNKTQTITRKNAESNKANFGRALYQTGDYLFSAAYKERNLSASETGSVYIFKKQNGAWSKIKKLTIAPSTSNDVRFGSTITGYGDYVAISAFIYTPSRIEVYKGNMGDFSSPTLWQSLPIPSGLAIDSYGNMAMNEDWLIATVLSNPSSGPANKLLFYKKGAGDQWGYHHEMTVGFASIITKAPPHVSIENNTLVASDGNSKVLVITFNPDTQQWSTSATLTASDPDKDPFFGSFYFDGSYFGASVKIKDDKIFVGAPAKNFNTTNDVGAIYVYTHNPGTNWTSQIETNKLLPVTKIGNTYFGSSLDVLKNTLVTGAGSTAVPGKAFVIQAKDYFWNTTVPLLELTGDTFVLDYYGIDVALSEDDFFIGASIENNSSGLSAGAVYVTASPPLITLEPPVCDSILPFDLVGYPFNGTWSGPGITDAQKGTFNPKMAGLGTIELTYQTPNCFYKSKLLITVVLAPVATIEGSQNEILCSAGKTTVTLAVAEQTGASYQWYYRKTEADPYLLTSTTTRTKPVSNTEMGQYQVSVSRQGCSIFNNFTVTKEMLSVQISPIEKFCSPTASSISLKANYSGGTWQILGNYSQTIINQTASTITVSSLPDGQYNMSYVYTSPAQCTYADQEFFTIDRIEPITVESTQTAPCNGRYFLTLQQKTSAIIATYSWLYKTENSGSVTTLSTTTKTLDINRSGYYWAKATEGLCSVESEIKHYVYKKVNADSVFVPNVFTPNGDDTNELFHVSTDGDFAIRLTVINRNGREIFSGDGNKGWDGGDFASGVYFWTVSFLDCKSNSRFQKGFVQLIR